MKVKYKTSRIAMPSFSTINVLASEEIIKM